MEENIKDWHEQAITSKELACAHVGRVIGVSQRFVVAWPALYRQGYVRMLEVLVLIVVFVTART